jgi:hypothetical protein
MGFGPYPETGDSCHKKSFHRPGLRIQGNRRKPDPSPRGTAIPFRRVLLSGDERFGVVWGKFNSVAEGADVVAPVRRAPVPSSRRQPHTLPTSAIAGSFSPQPRCTIRKSQANATNGKLSADPGECRLPPALHSFFDRTKSLIRCPPLDPSPRLSFSGQGLSRYPRIAMFRDGSGPEGQRLRRGKVDALGASPA